MSRTAGTYWKGCLIEIGSEVVVYASNTKNAFRFDLSDKLTKILRAYTWFESSSGYLCRHDDRPGGVRVSVPAHHIVIGLDTKPFENAQVDHIDRNKYNNHRDNLRWVTCSTNRHNCGLTSKNTSGYKGVSWRECRHKWRAACRVGGKTIHIGQYDSALEAARAYDKCAAEHGYPTNVDLGILEEVCNE